MNVSLKPSEKAFMIAELIIEHCQSHKGHHRCETCIKKILPFVQNAIENNQGLHFVLPAFPAKSANKDKTLGDVVDYGEFVALTRLSRMLSAIKKHYQLGAKLTICSDGRVFNDIVGVSDKAVDDYKQSFISLIDHPRFENINAFSLEEIYPNIEYKAMRELLVLQFAVSLTRIKQDIREEKNERALFNGLHRFLFEDMKYLFPNLSANKVRKMAHERTYLTIQRSHAWSALIKARFQSSIRLSIHPQQCESEKLGFKIIADNSHWATPWHNVTVKEKSLVYFMRNKEAKEKFKLVKVNGIPSHYQKEVSR